MNNTDPYSNSRRRFLGQISSAVSLAMLASATSTFAAEPPPETTTIRLVHDVNVPILCYGPMIIAEQFLRLEGFTEIHHEGYGDAIADAEVVAEGRADIAINVGSDLVSALDKGTPVVALSGLHPGCVELFVSDRVRDIRDLAGKKLLASADGVFEYVFLSSLIAFVGLHPRKDVEWEFESDYDKWPGLLAEGKVDVVSAFPPLNYLIREMKIGHVILNTTLDAPWRNLFCCMIIGGRSFVQNNPVATKRALRAILMANDLCQTDRDLTSGMLVERGVTDRLEFARRTLEDVPYGAWRDFDPSDTLRFYALRLKEAGLVKSSARALVQNGSDFRFLNEIRQELKL